MTIAAVFILTPGGSELVGRCCASDAEITVAAQDDLVDVDGLRDLAATDSGYEWPRCVRCGQKIDAVV